MEEIKNLDEKRGSGRLEGGDEQIEVRDKFQELGELEKEKLLLELELSILKKTKETKEQGIEKPTVVFCHGMFANEACWTKMADSLRKVGYDCVVPNLPFHAPHEKSEGQLEALGKTSLEDYYQFLLGVVEKIEGPVLLVGHSMGGFLTAKVSTNEKLRDKVLGAVLLTPAAPKGILSLYTSVIRGNLSGFVKSAWLGKKFMLTFGEFRYLLNGVSPKRIQEMLRKNHLTPESGTAARSFAFWLKDAEIEDKLICPTLVVGAEEDRWVPPKVTRQVAEKLGAEYVEVKGLGHWVVEDSGVLEKVLDWLDKSYKKSQANEKEKGAGKLDN